MVCSSQPPEVQLQWDPNVPSSGLCGYLHLCSQAQSHTHLYLNKNKIISWPKATLGNTILLDNTTSKVKSKKRINVSLLPCSCLAFFTPLQFRVQPMKWHYPQWAPFSFISKQSTQSRTDNPREQLEDKPLLDSLLWRLSALSSWQLKLTRTNLLAKSFFITPLMDCSVICLPWSRTQLRIGKKAKLLLSNSSRYDKPSIQEHLLKEILLSTYYFTGNSNNPGLMLAKPELRNKEDGRSVTQYDWQTH